MDPSFGTILPLALIALMSALVRIWFARSRDLGITLFRPYRGDPWPRGVQEDDEIRFELPAAAPDQTA